MGGSREPPITHVSALMRNAWLKADSRNIPRSPFLPNCQFLEGILGRVGDLWQFWGPRGSKVPIFPHFFWPKNNENLICETKLSSG